MKIPKQAIKSKQTIFKRATHPAPTPPSPTVTTTAADTPRAVFDVFTTATGKRIARQIADQSERMKRTGSELFLTAPSVEAYETEFALFEAITKAERDEINEANLQIIFNAFVASHSRNQNNPQSWTGADVPLFYLSAYRNGKYSDAATANYFQVCLLRAIWRDAEIKITCI